MQDPGWQCVLLGQPEAGVQPAAPVSPGHPQGDAHQPRQELASALQGAGVPLLPDLSYWRRKTKQTQQLGGGPAAETGYKHFRESSNCTAFKLKTLQVFKSYLK